jgi:hypothetical protein
VQQVMNIFSAGSETFKDHEDRDPPPHPGPAVVANNFMPFASAKSVEECMDEYFKNIPDPELILGPTTAPRSHPFESTNFETSTDRIRKWLNSPEVKDWKKSKSNVTSSNDPAESATFMARAVVRAERSISKYDNHKCIAIDTMANVNVFRNPDLVPEVFRVNRGMNIEGVGEIGTKTQSKGIHPLFGEVWILPSNSYNILSQYQTKLNGFLMQFSEDNETCWLEEH